MKKIYWWILLIPVAITPWLLLLSAGETADRQANEEFLQYYKIYSLSMPKSLSFAGNKVPLEEYDVAERYDREILTNVYWQSQTILMLKRAGRYFPMIEPILKAEGIPDDFKYVALAESGLQHVVSPAGAAGFWQFLDKTGKRYGLEVNENVDERYHIEKATKAACGYFKEAYAQLGNWSLVAASYNMGIEGVRKQIASQKVNNYFELYLNTETARYLFRILALKEIYEAPAKFGFQIGTKDLYTPIATVKLKADMSIGNLANWAVANGLNYKQVKLLNAWIRKPYLNITAPGKYYILDLPKDKIMKTNLAGEIKNDTLYLNNTQLPDRLDAKPIDAE